MTDLIIVEMRKHQDKLLSNVIESKKHIDSMHERDLTPNDHIRYGFDLGAQKTHKASLDNLEEYLKSGDVTKCL